MGAAEPIIAHRGDREDLPRPAGTTLLANALEGLDGHFLASRLQRGATRCILHVARDAPRAALLEQLVRFFAPEVEIVTVPAWDCLPYDRISPNPELMAQRLAALGTLAGTAGLEAVRIGDAGHGPLAAVLAGTAAAAALAWPGAGVAAAGAAAVLVLASPWPWRGGAG